MKHLLPLRKLTSALVALFLCAFVTAQEAPPAPVVPAWLDPIVEFLADDSANIDLSVGYVAQGSQSDDQIGDALGMIKLNTQIDIGNGVFNETGYAHLSFLDKPSDEVTCDSLYSAIGIERGDLYGKASTHRCLYSDNISAGDFVYETEIGYRRGDWSINLFRIETEGGGEVSFEGLRLTYRL